MKVGVAQVDVALGDLEANVAKHLDFIARARDQGCRVLVFPELSLAGYKIGHSGYRLGIDLEHPALARLAGAAGDMDVVVGFVEASFAAQFFNAAALLRDGEVRFVHRKLNLANYGDMEEGKFFAPGRYVEPFELEEGFTGALLLCSDLWNPALVHLVALHGATLLLAPTNSSLDRGTQDFSKPARWDLFLRFYATIYGLPVLFANRVGLEEPHEFWGGSRIVDAAGTVLAKAGTEEALVTAELSHDDVRKARYELPTVRDSNLDLIHREVERLYHRVGVPEKFRAR